MPINHRLTRSAGWDKVSFKPHQVSPTMGRQRQMRRTRFGLFLMVFIGMVPLAQGSELTLRQGAESQTISLSDIESSPLIHVEMRHPEGPDGRFSGVALDTFLADQGLSNANRVRFVAHDGYTTFLTPQQRREKRYMLVTRLNGEPIDIADLGPFMLIVPEDAKAVLEGTEPMTRWIWAIQEMGTR
ncbi:molybdopterin-dependent oxidoreductase [Halomonas tibetensis]|uniref:Molybdopterin-dependent oxidoreductase n=1 Tax=Halomonas tibetensis TaxID=2259590 RepID=A0ABV7B9K1_9GAMM